MKLEVSIHEAAILYNDLVLRYGLTVAGRLEADKHLDLTAESLARFKRAMTTECLRLNLNEHNSALGVSYSEKECGENL